VLGRSTPSTTADPVRALPSARLRLLRRRSSLLSNNNQAVRVLSFLLGGYGGGGWDSVAGDFAMRGLWLHR